MSFTDIGTLVIGGCILLGWMSMKAAGAKRFFRGLVLIPRIVLYAVVWIVTLPVRFFAGGLGAWRRM
jgi:hypothetical protein